MQCICMKCVFRCSIDKVIGDACFSEVTYERVDCMRHDNLLRHIVITHVDRETHPQSRVLLAKYGRF